MALPAKYETGEFIVRLDEQLIKDGAATTEVIDHLRMVYNYQLVRSQAVGKLRFLVLTGEAKHMSAIGQLNGVKYIEKNSQVKLFQSCEEEPSPGTWGLDRIDQRGALSYTNPTSSQATYIHGLDTGSDAVVYVIDTGIVTSDPEFGGRATWGYTAPDMSDEDMHGHGTHCAGTVGANSYGVAKDVTLVGVKVVNRFGMGTPADFTGGMGYIINDHLARSSSGMAKSVVSASLGYGTEQAVDDAAQEAIDAGIIVVAAAGNGDEDACVESPARVPEVITVGRCSLFSNVCFSLFQKGEVDLYTINKGSLICHFHVNEFRCFRRH